MVFEYGILLEHSQYNKLKAKLELLKERAPSCAHVHLEFKIKNVNLIGTLQISGMDKNFMVTSIGNDPLKLYQVLESEMDAKLLEWKKKRFRRENKKTVYAHASQMTG